MKLGEAENCGPGVASTMNMWVPARKYSAEGGVDVMAPNGGGVNSHVRRHIDHCSVKYEVIGKICDRVPIVACGLAGVVGRCVEGFYAQRRSWQIVEVD